MPHSPLDESGNEVDIPTSPIGSGGRGSVGDSLSGCETSCCSSDPPPFGRGSTRYPKLALREIVRWHASTRKFTNDRNPLGPIPTTGFEQISNHGCPSTLRIQKSKPVRHFTIGVGEAKNETKRIRGFAYEDSFCRTGRWKGEKKLQDRRFTVKRVKIMLRGIYWWKCMQCSTVRR